MTNDDSDSRGISAGSIALILIIALVGAVWWMNKYGAGGGTPPPPSQPSAVKADSIIKAQQLTDRQMQEKMNQDALNRRVVEGQAPALTPEQVSAQRGR